MRTKEIDEAIDMLQNCIADYVIGDFCVGKYCPMENECKDKDCPFNTAIDKVVEYIEELEKYKRKHSIVKRHYVSKDEIRDKIKELEKQTSTINDKQISKRYSHTQFARECCIGLLKELLEN